MTISKTKEVAVENSGILPISAAKAHKLLEYLPGWTLLNDRTLQQTLIMKDFPAAVRLIDAIAQVAQALDHHPDLHLTDYRRLTIELTTHSCKSLTENDFTLAAKIDALPRQLNSK